MKKALAILFALVIIKTNATTWDEPWHDQVVKKAQSFLLAKIVSVDLKKGIRLQLIKLLSGIAVSDTFSINGFNQLHLCSVSGGEGAMFNFEGVDSCYFFVSKNDSNAYSIATPTAGFAVLHNGVVSATYRHSYHQAAVDKDLYEKTMTAMFNAHHNIAYDTTSIKSFISLQLSQKPAGFDKSEIALFFTQHVALELLYHLKLKREYKELEPFLTSENFHAQVSAARALYWNTESDSQSGLLGLIQNDNSRNFVKVIAIWALGEQHAVHLKEQLAKLAATASGDENGFGGNIMDPRVCTHFPSVKAALNKLIASF